MANNFRSLDDKYRDFEDLDFSSDEDDCHPNIEINTWRRLKAQMREQKGIVKKEPILIDVYNTTAVNNKKQKYDITGQGNDPLHQNDDNNESNDNNEREQKEQSSASNGNNENIQHNAEATQAANVLLSQTTEKIPDTIDETSDNSQAAQVQGPQSKQESQSPNVKKEKGNGLFEARSDPKIFLDEYLPKIKKFSKMKDDSKSDDFLRNNCELIHEACEGFIITFAVDRAVQGASIKQLKKYSKRCLTIHNLIQSCISANVAPKVGVPLFYSKMTNPRLKQMYAAELEKQVNELMGRIEIRRKERLAEAAEAALEDDNNDDKAEYIEEKAPVGPGGLDPTEVLNSLPQRMQQAFISRDVSELRKVLSELPVEEAQKHMQQCIDSGLWVDNADLMDPAEAADTVDTTDVVDTTEADATDNNNED